MSFLISQAQAATGAAGQPPNAGLGTMLMLGVFFIICYFLLWAPQQKKAKEHRNLLSNLSKGDEVVINGGILGKITKITDDYAVVKIANDVEIRIQKGAVNATLPKGTIKAIV